MFQTELNLFLQSHGSPVWDAFWVGVSELGRTPSYLAVLVVLAFGVDLRRTWWLGVALLWAGALTQFAKDWFALPRPFDVDSRVAAVPAGSRQDLFTARGGGGFVALLPADVVDYYRARGGIDWGLPSGHTASFATCVGGFSLLFLRRRWWMATLAAATVMGLSRLYLGRHFLADVLAGAALGCAVVAALHQARERGAGAPAWLRAGFLFLAPAALLPLAFRHGQLYAAQLWAWNLGCWLLSRRGREFAGGTAAQRAGRVGLAVAAGGLGLVGARALVAAVGILPAPWDELAVAFAGVLCLLAGGAPLAERLGLYPPADPPSADAGRPVGRPA